MNNQEIISRLKFICKIKRNDKINTKYMYVQPYNLYNSFSRTFFYNDNRTNALNFCYDTIKRAFELLITYERSDNNSDKVLFKNLLSDLQNVTEGLSNLRFTYLSDTKFSCDMDTLLEYIIARLHQYIDKQNIEDCSLEKNKQGTDI